MTRVLVLYASKHGHTANHLEPWRYDAGVIGASIHAGRHQKAVLNWVTDHAGVLNIVAVVSP